MESATVISRNDPRARTLLACCLILCCGTFVAELIAYLFMQDANETPVSALHGLLVDRYLLFSMGRPGVATYAVIGFLLHAGIAAILGATLQRLWLRSWKLAASTVILIFMAFQVILIGLAMG